MYLKIFDIKKVKTPSSIFVVGKSASGKTCLVKDIMNTLGSTKDIIFNGTEDLLSEYRSFVSNKKQVRTKLGEEFFKNCEKFQKASNYLSKFLIIFDNMDDTIKFDDRSTNSTPYMRRMLMIHRHLNISLLITRRMITDISPVIRSNIDYMFITKNTCPMFIDSICNKFLTNMSSNYVLSLMEKLELYECLVVDNINNELYKHKAKIHLSREEVATIAIQKFWRRILAQRKLQRLRIGNEIELLPVIGKKYRKGLKRFNIAKC